MPPLILLSYVAALCSRHSNEVWYDKGQTLNQYTCSTRRNCNCSSRLSYPLPMFGAPCALKVHERVSLILPFYRHPQKSCAVPCTDLSAVPSAHHRTFQCATPRVTAHFKSIFSRERRPHAIERACPPCARLDEICPKTQFSVPRALQLSRKRA